MIDGRQQISRPENLAQRAYLNALTSWLDTGSKIAVGFFLSPFIVSSLGAAMFGVWQILRQLNQYMVTVDVRSSTALKWIIARDRTIVKDVELRRSVTAALGANLLVMPLYGAAGVLIVWLAPYISDVEPESFDTVRLTASLLALTFVVSQILFVFESVLQGMNLSYKRMGIRAAITVGGGACTAGVLYLGYGLPSMASVQLAVVAATGFAYLGIVLRHVPWFGLARVTFGRVVEFVKLAGWFMVLKVVETATIALDLVLLGYLAGAEYVAAYTITRFVMASSATFCVSAVGAIVPGLSRLLSEKRYKEILRARQQLLIFFWLFFGVVGSVSCIWNRSFVEVWIGKNLFAGEIENLLIVVLVIFRSLEKIDGSILVMSLDVRTKVVIGGTAVAILAVLAFLLVPEYKIMGVLFAMVVSSFFLNGCYTCRAAALTRPRRPIAMHTYFSRTPIVCAVFVLGSWAAGMDLRVETWPLLIASVSVTFSLSALTLWFLALSGSDRQMTVEALSRVKLLGTN